jgi:large subunit ribosomal protein L6
MSRYGKIPIPLPKGVELQVAEHVAKVKGPKGELNLPVKEGIRVQIEGEQVVILTDENARLPKAMHGLYRSLIHNMIVGVSKGFEKKLSLVGVGYRASVQGKQLDLQLGFSHPTKIEIPKELQVSVDKSTTIVIQGIDKQVVGQFAAVVRSIRKPEPYKGKGVRYATERVRKKAGKAAKGKTA